MEYHRLIVLFLVLLQNVSVGWSAKVKRRPFCQMKLDLTFVIDSSVSIRTNDFKKQREFIKDIVKFLDVSADRTRVAAVSFSNYVKPEFLLNKYSTKKEVLTAISKIQHYQGDATRTYKALDYTHSVIYKAGNGEREGVMDVVVVLTDGETNPGKYDRYVWKALGKNMTQEEANKIKSRPAVVFAIGVGTKVDKNELNGISSDPDSRFTILVPTFNELNSKAIKEMLLNRTCFAVKTTTPVPVTTTTPKPKPKPTPKPTPTPIKPIQKEEGCKEAVADIFFLLDESSSIKRYENFKKELDFVNKVTDYLEIGPRKTRVGLLTFSDVPKMKFHLDEYTDKTSLSQAISEIPWGGGNTFLDRALKMVRKEGLFPGRGSRSDVPQIAVVITDGVSTNPSATRKELKEIHKQNYITFAIGVGPGKNSTELALIADDRNNVFGVDNLDGLLAIRKSLLSRICVEVKDAAADQPKKPKP